LRTPSVSRPKRVATLTRRPFVQPLASQVDLAAKRLFDVVASAAGLVVLAVPMLAIALAVGLGDGGPALYRAQRIGRHGVPFRMLKFRTMVLDADRIGGTSTAMTDPRITPTGRVLRRYKLDEVPQLFNVLRGDMSLVGPRPEVAEYTRLYSSEEQEILQVQPGMTDLASIRFFHLNQILATSDAPDAYYRDVIRPEKNRLRLEYARHRSFWLDLRILLRTLVLALGGRPRDGT
jgi:lipopolysaccharide/colanic/teichoic acid biosynthesis glycosyltransferase